MTTYNDKLLSELAIILAEGEKNDKNFILTALGAAAAELRATDRNLGVLQKEWAVQTQHGDTAWEPSTLAASILSSTEKANNRTEFYTNPEIYNTSEIFSAE